MFGWGNMGDFFGFFKEVDIYMIIDVGKIWKCVMKGIWMWVIGD